MKKNFLFLAITGLILSTVFFSCSGGGKNSATTAQETKLKGYMLGGMYFVAGYGGVATVEKIVAQNGDGKEDLVNSYSELFILPFKQEQGDGAKSTLSSMWNINSKADFDAAIEKLKTQNNTENPHKAWDFARAVNNICMGYAAGYLTKDEADTQVAEILPLAQKAFKTWADYMNDFNEGRKIWSSNDAGNATFQKTTNDLLANTKGIYSLIPLN